MIKIRYKLNDYNQLIAKYIQSSAKSDKIDFEIQNASKFAIFGFSYHARYFITLVSVDID